MTTTADDHDPRARAELRALVERYGRAADLRDGELFADVFCDDGVLLTTRGPIEGREALAAIPPKLARYRSTMHMVGNHHVELDDATPDDATGEVQCLAYHYSDDGDGTSNVYVMHIRYHDRYRRTDAGWRIAERRLDLLFDETRQG